jgi:hypothetical protein
MIDAARHGSTSPTVAGHLRSFGARIVLLAVGAIVLVVAIVPFAAFGRGPLIVLIIVESVALALSLLIRTRRFWSLILTYRLLEVRATRSSNSSKSEGDWVDSWIDRGLCLHMNRLDKDEVRTLLKDSLREGTFLNDSTPRPRET